MIHTILETLARIGTLFELPGQARQRLHGPLVRFSIHRHADWTGLQAEQLLLKFGIRIHGRNFDKEHLHFHVPAHQANWAEYILHRYNAPLTSTYNPNNQAARGRGPIPDWSQPLQPKGLLSKICDFLYPGGDL